MQSPDEMAALFRQRRLKVTPQRERIFRAVARNEQHPTAESIYRVVRAEMPTISLKTVYQTLKELVDLGIIQHVDLGTGSARFDPNLGQHHHLVCSKCGKVLDLRAEAIELRLPDASPFGFRIHTAEIVLRGLCEDCGKGNS